MTKLFEDEAHLCSFKEVVQLRHGIKLNQYDDYAREHKLRAMICIMFYEDDPDSAVWASV